MANEVALSLADVFPYGAPELKKIYPRYLTGALVVALGCHFLGVGGWIGAQRLQRKQGPRQVRIRILHPTDLGPPPSIAGSAPPAIAATVPVKPSIGMPVPVPDAQISEEATIATQQEMGQVQHPVTMGQGGAGDSLVISLDREFPEGTEPDINAFVPREVEPAVIRQVWPEYPELARKAGVEGRVIVKVLVDREGKVQKAVVIEGPAVLHQAARTAALHWVFKPAIQQDRAVAVWVAIPFHFKLR